MTSGGSLSGLEAFLSLLYITNYFAQAEMSGHRNLKICDLTFENLSSD